MNRFICKHKNQHQRLKLNTEEIDMKKFKQNAEIFSINFASVANSILLKIPNTQNTKFRRSVHSSMFSTEANLTEVRGEIERLKLSASHNVDLISNKFHKKFAAILAPFITYPIIQSFSNQNYPIDFKKGIVITLREQGSRTNINNYRFISILQSLTKNFEKVIIKKSSGFLEKFKILSEK